MIVQCEHCRRSYESDTADENCPHEQRSPSQGHDNALTDAIRTALDTPEQQSWATVTRGQQAAIPQAEYVPAFGGLANQVRLPIIGDVGSILDVTVQAQPAIPGADPIDLAHEQYELHETPAGERFYRHIEQDNGNHPQPHGKRWAGIRVLTDTTAPEHHIFGAANQQRAREAKRRLNR